WPSTRVDASLGKTSCSAVRLEVTVTEFPHVPERATLWPKTGRLPRRNLRQADCAVGQLGQRVGGGSGRRRSALDSCYRFAIAEHLHFLMKGHVMRRVLVAAIVCVSVLGWNRSAAFAICGDGVVDTNDGEDCDVGGTCIASSNAGTACTAAGM